MTDRATALFTWAHRTSQSPLARVLAITFVVFAVGFGWGLPASDGWDNDGVAPRDFLVALSETFSSGPTFDSAYLHYAPVHLTLLGVLTLPISITAVLNSASHAPADVIHEILKVPYMTAIMCVSRVVAIAMALGIVYAMAKIGEELGTKRTGVFVAVVCGCNAVLVYYAHTSCLDVPALFWGSFALLTLVRAIARHEPRLLRRFAVLVVLAVGSKDQAYALFVLGAPLAVATFFVLDAWARQNARAVLREAAVACAIGVALFLVVDGVAFNPAGFRARIAFLTGPASKDYNYYSRDLLGRALAVRDSILYFVDYYPPAFGGLFALGLAGVIARGRKDRTKLAAGLVPLFGIVSFTLLFTLVALRTEHRFLLPHMVLWSVYGGLGLEWLVMSTAPGWRRMVGRTAAVLTVGWGAFMAADMDANLVFDTRYDAEDWLRAHVVPGDTIETYGLNCYLPRFPATAHVVRIGPEKPTARNPLYGAEEREDLLSNVTVRNPRFLVVPQAWAGRYLFEPSPTMPSKGHFWAALKQVENTRDVDATSFFRGIMRGDGPYPPSGVSGARYRRVHTSEWSSKVWPRVTIHASVSEVVWIFERADATASVSQL